MKSILPQQIISILTAVMLTACGGGGSDTGGEGGTPSGSNGRFNLSVDLSKGYALQQDTYGVNNSLVTQAYYETDPTFTAEYKALRCPTYRFPGGTIGNYFNCLTGKSIGYEGIDADTYDNRVAGTNKSIAYNKPDGHSYDPMCKFLSESGGVMCMQLNVIAMSGVDVEAFFKDIKSQGVTPKYVEMGNELYFNSYAAAIKDIDDYIKRCKYYGDIAKDIFPAIKIGVVIPSHMYTDESYLDEGDVSSQGDRQEKWYNTLKSDNSFFDSVIIHLYSETGMSSNTATANFLPYLTAYKNCLSHSDKMFSGVLNMLAKDFPTKTIWCTEYHVGGFSGNVTKYRIRYSYLGGLYASTNLLKLFKTSSVEVGSWHNMVQWFDYTRNRNGKIMENVDFKMKVNIQFISMFTDAVRESNMFTDVTINNCNTYSGTNGYSGNNKDIEAGMFYDLNDKEYYIVVINKLNSTYNWDSSSLIASLSTNKGAITKVTTLTAKDNSKLENTSATYELRDFGVKSEMTPTNNVVTFKPYSVSVIKIE